MTSEAESAVTEKEVQVKPTLKKSKLLIFAIGITAPLLIITILFLTKDLFVAALVNGSPISRLAVIKELEKQGGKQALAAMIDKKLIEAELAKQNITISQDEIGAEIKKIEAQVASQGGTLQAALAAEGMTEERLREQISTQKRLEKLLADKILVTDADIETYIKDSKIVPPADMKPEEFKTRITEQLKQEKLQAEAQKWIADLTKSAKIEYFVNY